MKPCKCSLVALCASALLITLFAACPNPISPTKGGALAISINNNINARTLLPLIDMNAASFKVIGTGPSGATFSQTTSGGSLTVDSLAFGSWSVTVNALNAGGTIIGSGQATVTVHTGQTTTVDISVVPLAGNGTLDLTVTWTASQVEDASIQASLTPPVGSETHPSFSVSGNEATWSSTTIPAGYQTLTLQLFDHNIFVMGAVEVVRIVAGQATTGTYAFANVNQPGGSVQVNISPAMADPILVSISGVPATVSAGASMTATASVSDGTTGVDYVWYLNGESVGMGASYTLGSTVAAGWYRLDVTAYAAGGTRAGSATASFRVTATNSSAGPFAYVTNFGSGTVSAYTIGSGGLLSPLSTPAFTAGRDPFGIAATPDGSFLYVTNPSGGIVSAYAIGSDGMLTTLSTPIFASGVRPTGIAVTPNGSYLYVTGFEKNRSVGAFAIGSDGQFAQLSTFAAGGSPYGIAVTPNGSFLYVTNSSSNTLSGYRIGSDGRPTPLSTPTFAAGDTPEGIAVTPNGSFLYVANYGDGSVSGYAIGSGGLLTSLSTPAFATGLQPAGIAVTPNGSFFYVTNSGSNTVSGYAIGSDGLLTPLSIPSFDTEIDPEGIAVTPDGSFLYVTNQGSNTVSGYTIGSDGLLTPLSTPAFAAGGGPIGILVVP